MRSKGILTIALGLVGAAVALSQAPAGTVAPGLPPEAPDAHLPSLQSARDPGSAALLAACKERPAPRGGGAARGAAGAGAAGAAGGPGGAPGAGGPGGAPGGAPGAAGQGGAAGARAGAPAAALGPIVAPPALDIPGVIKGGTAWKFVWQERGNNGDGIVGAADGGVLLAQNDNSQIIEVYPDGKSKVLYKDTHTSGAVSMTKKGILYVNERGLHEVVMELAPKKQVLADHFPNGDPLDCEGLLNDLTAASDGGLYYTGGPYYVSPKGVVTKEGGDDAPGGNGIILSPDEKTLYITGRMRNAPPAPMGYGGGLVAFDVQPGGHLTNARQFADTCGDGSTIDAAGRIYCTGGRIPDPSDATKSIAGIGVVGPDGKILGVIPFPNGCISVAFGGKDKKTLFMLYSGGREVDGSPIKKTAANPGGGANATTGQAAQLWSIDMEAQGYKGRAK